MLQKEFEESYATAQLVTKDEISRRQGVGISEAISDEVRLWFRDYQVRTGKFPDFPSEDHGGSRNLLSRQATESEISKSSAVSSKDSKKNKDKMKTPTKTGDLNVEENCDDGFKTSQSLFLPDLKMGIDE